MSARLLAEVVADSTLAVGIRERADNVADEVEQLLTEPVGWFTRHPNWPSALTSGGLPFEFSIAISSDGSPFVRYGVDVTDHRRGMAGNWGRYLKYARYILGVSSEGQAIQTWGLFARHLDGIRATARTRVGHAVGYGPSDLRRASLFFNTYWLSYAEFEDSFPDYATSINTVLSEHGGATPSRVDWISYDFADGGVFRTKFYWRLASGNQVEQLPAIIGRHPDIAAASQVFSHFRESGHLHQIGSSIGLQLSLDEEKLPRQKLLFSCYAWKWNQPRSFLDLLIYLSDSFSLELWSLNSVLHVFSEHGVQLRPTTVGIGPGGLKPSVSFSFCPVLEDMPFIIPVEGATSLGEFRSKKNSVSRTFSNGCEAGSCSGLIDEMVARGIDYVLRARVAEGHWVDFHLPQGSSDEWVTAYVIATLSGNPMCRSRLAPAAMWLRSQFRQGEGWGYGRSTCADADSTALSLVALHRMGVPLPSGAGDILLRYRLSGGGYRTYIHSNLDYECGSGASEVTSVVLLAQLEIGLADICAVGDTVAMLVSQQRDEGGWNSFWWKDDLFATLRALAAINAFIRSANHANGSDRLTRNVNELAAKAFRDARPSISAHPIAEEPFVLGLWLSSWFAACGDVHYPSVGRILRSLHLQQQADGRWLSVPIRRIARTKLLRPWARSDSGALYLDSRCLVTTATVIEGLSALRQASEAIRSRMDVPIGSGERAA